MSFFMKTWEVGLAYNNGLGVDLDSKLMTYSADRSPDLGSLVELVNSIANQDPAVNQVTLDYLLSQTFSIPRTMWTFTQRGRALARDIRNGNSPEKIGKFSEAILKLRNDPALLEEISRARLQSICGVLVQQRCNEKQKTDHSIFFFVGPEKMLSDVENRLPIPKLLRVWPSDFWLP